MKGAVQEGREENWHNLQAVDETKMSTRRQCQSNYSEEEDMIIARAWVVASEDSLLGNKMAGKEFQHRHFDLFEEMSSQLMQDPNDESST